MDQNAALYDLVKTIDAKLDALLGKHSDLSERVAKAEAQIEVQRAHPERIGVLERDLAAEKTALRIYVSVAAAIPVVLEFVLHFVRH